MTQLEQVIYNAIEESLANMHTATIAKVTKVNAKTINCKPVFNRVVDGQSIQLPEFVEVPVFVLQGGSSSLRMPVSAGDYALLIFTERCFDGWWNGQDYKRPLEYRMHDYSDALALIGLNNASGAKAIPTVTTLDGKAEHIGNMDRTGDTNTSGNTDSATYSTGGTPGVGGTFTTADGKTVTVTNGLITNIV